MSTPLLGWIEPNLRNNKQNDAHAKACANLMQGTGLAEVKLDPGQKILLTDAWRHPTVVSDLGSEFTGFRQLTGACVGVSAGNWVTTSACLQRLLSTNPTKAFISFWPFPYGRTRYNEGDRGQGEGAIDSVMGQTIATEGYFDITQQGLPTFDKSDGLALTSKQELQWSDGGSSLVTAWLPTAKLHLGVKAQLNSTDDIWNAIANGYPVIDGCNNYCGHGTVQGDVSIGVYDGRGGHSTCFLGVYNHTTLGRLFLYSNQWDGNTYPQDGSGKARCTTWMKESTVAKLFQTGGNGGETMALSHVDFFPAQPNIQEILTWAA